MSKAHKGSRLILKEQVVAVPFESAHFDYNIDATGICFGDIVEPTNRSTYTMRPSEGYFGGGVGIDEGTINLSNISDSGWNLNVNNFQGYFSVSTSTSGMETSAIFNFGPKSNISGGGWQVAQYSHGYGSQWVSGNSYTWSIYIKRLNSEAKAISVRLIESNAVSPQGPTISIDDNVPIGEWQRISGSWTASSSASASQFYITARETSSFEVANPQIEQKNYPTSFTRGNRGAGLIEYDGKVIDKNKGAVSCWIKIVQTGNWRRIVAFSTSNDLNFDINGNRLRMKLSGTSIYATNDLEYDRWYHVACSWGEGGEKIYINGKLEGSHTSKTGIAIVDSRIGIGARTDYNSPLNGIISDLVIYGSQITDEEIEAVYISQQPLYNPYDYRAFSL